MSQKPVGEKLEKIAREMEEAGATKWETMKVIRKLEEGQVQETKLRESAIEALREINGAAAGVMASFEKLKVYTSAERLENFDRGNIIRSLLKETRISRALAEKIGGEVEDMLKDLKAGYLNTALIREIVNVKLLEYGQDGIREEYARLGMPVYDVGKKLESGFFGNAEILKEYYLLKVIPPKARELHFSGEINIANAGDFGSRIFSGTLNFGEKDAHEVVPEIYAKFAERQGFFSMPLNIPSINMQLAPVIQEMSAKKMHEFSAFLAKHLQKIYSSYGGKEKGCIGIDLYGGEEFGLKQEQKENAVGFGRELFSRLSKYENPGFVVKVSVDSKYKTRIMKDEIRKGGISFVNCCEGRIIPLNDGAYCSGSGISGYFGINLAAISGKYPDDFIEKSEEILQELNALSQLKEKLLSEKKYFGENGIDIGGFRPALGIYGISQLQETQEHAKGLDKFFSSVARALGKNWIAIDAATAVETGRIADASRDAKSGERAAASRKSAMARVTVDNAAALEEMLEKKISEVVVSVSRTGQYA